MHDDLIERRLRSALHDDAAQLPFTITAAELERRVSLRGRATGGRRLTLLLAAAVAIGGIGASVLAGALSNQTPRPTAPVTAVQPTPDSHASPVIATPTATESPVVLPALDALIGADDSDVLVAQAHGPADGAGVALPDFAAGDEAGVILGDIVGDGEYRVSAACLGSSPLKVSVHAAQGATPDGAPVPCDGAVHDRSVSIDGVAAITLTYADPTSWRVVVRSTHHALPLPTTDPIIEPTAEGLDELARVEDRTVGADGQPWADGGMVAQAIAEIPARLRYRVRLWCEPGHSMRLLVGDEVDDDAVISPFTETHILCDGLVHDMAWELPAPAGARVFAASQPDARWSLVIESPTPPVDDARVSGWQQEGGIGPELSFETHTSSFSSAIEGGGPLMVVVDCAGPEQDIEVTVDVTVPLGDDQGLERFTARCTTEGQESGKEFATTSGGFIASYTAPAGTWSTMTILSRDPDATPQ